MIVSLIILSLENVKVANFDVYFEPVIKELEELWKGGGRIGHTATSRSLNICVKSHADV